MPTLKTTLKNAALQTLRASGVFSLARSSARRQQKLLILCYHGISLQDEHEWAGHLFVTPERFRQRMEALRAMNAAVLPLAEGVERLQSGSLPPRSVVLTFDDGFHDFAQLAQPILSDLGYPCTLYWTTYYADRSMPIVNLALDYLLWKSRLSSVAFPSYGIMQPMPNVTWQERAAIVRKLLAQATERGLSTEGKDQLAAEVAEQLLISYGELRSSRIVQIMTAEEAAAVARAGTDVQLHTHRHRTPRDRALFEREITDNRLRIREVTGRNPTHFCYPSGVHEKEFLPWLRALSVITATTCERGFATEGCEPLSLPRLLDDSNMASVQFEAYVSGVLG